MRVFFGDQESKSGSFFICELAEPFRGCKYICLTCFHNFCRLKAVPKGHSEDHIEKFARGAELHFGRLPDDTWAMKFNIAYPKDVLKIQLDMTAPDKISSYRDLAMILLPDQAHNNKT